MRTELVTRGLRMLDAAYGGAIIYEPQCSILTHEAIAQLVAKGWLVRNPFKPRELTITPAGRVHCERSKRERRI